MPAPVMFAHRLLREMARPAQKFKFPGFAPT